jgi:hypothetical protein
MNIKRVGAYRKIMADKIYFLPIKLILFKHSLNQQLGILLNSNAHHFNLLCKRLLTLQAVVSINLNGLL